MATKEFVTDKKESSDQPATRQKYCSTAFEIAQQAIKLVTEGSTGRPSLGNYIEETDYYCAQSPFVKIFNGQEVAVRARRPAVPEKTDDFKLVTKIDASTQATYAVVNPHNGGLIQYSDEAVRQNDEYGIADEEIVEVLRMVLQELSEGNA